MNRAINKYVTKPIMYSCKMQRPLKSFCLVSMTVRIALNVSQPYVLWYYTENMQRAIFRPSRALLKITADINEHLKSPPNRIEQFGI